jgi:ribonuclease BN (tRNA processing enzyme)
MRLTVVGCSGSIPSPGSPASCYLLEAEGFRLVLDLGSGALGPLQRYAAVLLCEAGRLVLTHLDPDEDPAQNLAGAQDAFPDPVTFAAPGQVIDLALAG